MLLFQSTVLLSVLWATHCTNLFDVGGLTSGITSQVANVQNVAKGKNKNGLVNQVTNIAQIAGNPVGQDLKKATDSRTVKGVVKGTGKTAQQVAGGDEDGDSIHKAAMDTVIDIAGENLKMTNLKTNKLLGDKGKKSKAKKRTTTTTPEPEDEPEPTEEEKKDDDDE